MNKMSSVFEVDKYTTPVTHIISEYIREYDIAKANINILLYKGLITQTQFNKLYNLPGEERKRIVGCMQRDNKTVNQGLQKGFYEARKMFYEANNINEYEILSVKKDAIFLINKIPSVTSFGNIQFIEKNIYTSFYMLGGLELYYFYDSITKVEKLDVKGISYNMLDIHKDWMLDLLMYIFGTAQEYPSKHIVNLISNISEQYLTGELGVNCFREFNNRSLFRTKIVINGERMYLTCLNPKVQVKDIDPAYNYNILQELYRIFVGLYLKSAQYKR